MSSLVLLKQGSWSEGAKAVTPLPGRHTSTPNRSTPVWRKPAAAACPNGLQWQDHFGLGSGPLVQPSLRISQPGDALEQEAERVAERVMRMPDSSLATSTHAHVEPSSDLLLQRTCASCAFDLSDEPEQAQRSSDSTPLAAGASGPSFRARLRFAQAGGGEPLP
ncbi:MAG TPA: hypothetical protein VIV60_08405, partial [Polyangiaceae bacterium]